MKNIFFEYGKILSSDEKISYLHSCHFKSNENLYEINIINCLLALENNTLTHDNIHTDNSIFNVYRKLFRNVESYKYWWVYTVGIIYLKIGKYDIKYCKKAKKIFESLRNIIDLEDIIDLLLFNLGHVNYELGKLENELATSIGYYNESLRCFTEISDTKYDNIYQAVIKNMLGNIDIKLANLSGIVDKSYNDAEKLFEEALKLFPRFSYPYNGLGNIYRERGEYDKAILYYKIAATIDDKFMYPWNYMGDCFRYLEKYDMAYKCFQRAINICNNNNVILPLYGLGRIYYELGNRNNNNEKYYLEAIEYFRIVEEKSPTYPPQIRFTLKDMAMAYQKLGLYQDAIKKYDIIINRGMFNKQKNYDNLIKTDKETCQDKIDLINCCNSSAIVVDPAYYIMCNTLTKGIQKRVCDMKESFDVSFLRREKISNKSYNELKNECNNNGILTQFFRETKDSINSYFEILRRWNSYTPIIRDGRGGGYFLKVNDYGVVIDPGFNFIKNFKEAGHSFSEIDIILITHAHDDHTSDLESILNMHHRYNKFLKETVLVRDIAKEMRISSTELLNDEKNKNIINERYQKSKKNLILFISDGVYSKYSGLLNEKAIKINNAYNDIINNNIIENNNFEIYYKVLKIDDEIIIEEETLRITAVRANHKDLFKGKQCLGFVINLKNEIIVYTGDTGWYNKEMKNLQSQLEDIRVKNINSKKIVLVAHLGGFKECEDKYWKNNVDKMYYEDHLGRLGLVRVVEALQPDICLISEFGEEFNGLRTKITEMYEQAFMKCNFTTRFFPADIGLILNLDHKTFKTQLPNIKVISGIDFKNKTICYEYVEPNLVSVGEFRNKNALFYYNTGRVTTSDCIQALLEGYIDDSSISGSNLKLSF